MDVTIEILVYLNFKYFHVIFYDYEPNSENNIGRSDRSGLDLEY